MTGMDVMRRCREFDQDMARLRLRLACVRDAQMRLTRSIQTSGFGGGGEDRMAGYAAQVDAIEREIRAREAQYIADVEAAARLVDRLPPEQGLVMHLRMVCGMTVRQTAAHTRQTEASVKGLCRRARETLAAMKTTDE